MKKENPKRKEWPFGDGGYPYIEFDGEGEGERGVRLGKSREREMVACVGSDSA